VRLAHGEKLILRNSPAGDLSVAHEVFVQEVYRSPRPLPAVSRIVDVGANTGFSLLYFANRYEQAKLIAFEPHPMHVTSIRQHLRINGSADRVEVVPAAAGIRESRGFLLDEGERSQISESGGAGRIPIAVVDFYKTIGDEQIDLLKLDCEGGEYNLIMDERFARLKVRATVLEWHASTARPSAGEELRQRLRRLGFGLEAESEKETGGLRSGMLWAYRE
jgi:FkbM family methyltransferase